MATTSANTSPDEFTAIFTYISHLDTHEIDELQACRDGSGPTLSDEELAYALFAEEAQGLLNFRKDYVGEDELSLVDQLAYMEDMARQDREMAIALSEGREPPARREWRRPTPPDPVVTEILLDTSQESAIDEAITLSLVDEGRLIEQVLGAIQSDGVGTPSIDGDSDERDPLQGDTLFALALDEDPHIEEVTFLSEVTSVLETIPGPSDADEESYSLDSPTTSSAPAPAATSSCDMAPLLPDFEVLLPSPPSSPTSSLLTLVEHFSCSTESSGKGKAIAIPPPVVEILLPPKVCTVCTDDIVFTAVDLTCGHSFDVECMRTLFRKATSDESLFPPQCCMREIMLADVRHHLPPSLAAEFTAKAREFRTRNRVYCHRRTCSAFLGEGTATPVALECEACSTSTCAACKDAAHAGQGCSSPADQEVLGMAKQQGWQRCPGCFHLVELFLGCHHMTCVCGQQFCYLCAATWKTCTCPQFAEERLLLPQ